jgi:hypothetical protein
MPSHPWNQIHLRKPWLLIRNNLAGKMEFVARYRDEAEARAALEEIVDSVRYHVIEDDPLDEA